MEKVLSAVLLAGGSGSRFGAPINKVLIPYRGKPLLLYSLEQLLRHPAVLELVLVCREEDEDTVRALIQPFLSEELPPVRLVRGGAQRQDSVRNALAACRGKWVLIHDGARPALKSAYIDACLAAMEEVPGASIAVPSKDTVKLTDDRGLVAATTDRRRTWIVQTPQCFRTDLLRAAHAKYAGRTDMTDDCMLLEAEGLPVKLLPGDYSNLKITVPGDLDALTL